ncbi:MAG TPA: PAS domain-containing protein [Lacunisphaera sp.]|jgi:PAS domain S-box-containing protein
MNPLAIEFQKLAEEAPAMIWMAGLDTGCFYFNRTWLEYRGRTTEMEKGSGWATGVHPDDLNRCVNFYLASFEERAPFVMTYRLQDRFGQYHSILDRGAPHYDEANNFLGFVGGCVVLVEQSPTDANKTLGVSLQEIARFALDLARSEAEISDTVPGGAAHARRHAIAQLKNLARDMVTNGHLGPAECRR